ncbi:MAG: hypothetical protein KBD51_01440 [Candidatus Levybacteria bacterium]|nr:hypothetical protein [Candidatus Levybacteria bacterium]
MSAEYKTLRNYSLSLGRLVSVSEDRSVRSYEGFGKKSAVIKIPDSNVHLTVRRYSGHEFGDENELSAVHVVRGGHLHHEPLLSFDRIQGREFTYQGFAPDGDSWRFNAETPDQMIGFLASLFNPGQLGNRGVKVRFVPSSNNSSGRTVDFNEYVSRHTSAPILQVSEQRASTVA